MVFVICMKWSESLAAELQLKSWFFFWHHFATFNSFCIYKSCSVSIWECNVHGLWQPLQVCLQLSEPRLGVWHCAATQKKDAAFFFVWGEHVVRTSGSWKTLPSQVSSEWVASSNRDGRSAVLLQLNYNYVWLIPNSGAGFPSSSACTFLWCRMPTKLGMAWRWKISAVLVIGPCINLKSFQRFRKP